MSYTELCFNAVGFNYDVEGVNPHFTCPSCHKAFEPKVKPVPVLPPVFDFNQKIAFLCPNCQAKIVLFVALHKDINGLQLCIQKSSEEGADGIPSDWWRT